ncbi:ABC transporter permease [Natrialbaceae archaeon A-CW1-1]
MCAQQQQMSVMNRSINKLRQYGYNARHTYSRFDLSARISIWIVGIIVLMSIFAPLLAPHDPNIQNYEQSLASPSFEHPLGTDLTGRDILSRLIYGGRISLMVGLGAVGIAAGIGLPIGSIAGFKGGWTDEFLMRIMDVILSFPALVLALAIIGAVGPSLTNIIIVIGVVYSPQYARLIRGSVLSVKEEEFVEAAENTGLSQMSVLRKHIIPNSLTPVIVQATFHIATAILAEAALSFLGLGVQPPTASWGIMIADGRNYLPDQWWISTFPGIAIMVTVLAFNLFGDGLRDEFDPRSDTSAGPNT